MTALLIIGIIVAVLVFMWQLIVIAAADDSHITAITILAILGLAFIIVVMSLSIGSIP